MHGCGCGRNGDESWPQPISPPAVSVAAASDTPPPLCPETAKHGEELTAQHCLHNHIMGLDEALELSQAVSLLIAQHLAPQASSLLSI